MMKKIKHQQCISYITVYCNMYTNEPYYHMLIECESGIVFSEIIDDFTGINLSTKLYNKIHDNMYRYMGDFISLLIKKTMYEISNILDSIYGSSHTKVKYIQYNESKDNN